MTHPTSPPNKDEDMYLQHVSSLIDGELDAKRLLEVIDRIADTEECRAFYRKARALSGLVAAAEPAVSISAPASIWTAIAQRSGLEPESRPASGGTGQTIALWFKAGTGWTSLQRGPALAAVSMTILLVTLTGLTWIGLNRESLNINVSPSTDPSSLNLGADSSAFSEEATTKIALGSSENMNDSRFIDLATEILRADHRYRKELLRLMTDVEQSSSTPSEGLGEGYSASGRGSRSMEGLERDALDGSGSGARVRVPMW